MVKFNSKLEIEWNRMKRSIQLANEINTHENTAFDEILKQALVHNVNNCKAERRKDRSKIKPKDISDQAIVKAAAFTDSLPLANYEFLMHLVPRLVNIVTVKKAQIPSHSKM